MQGMKNQAEINKLLNVPRWDMLISEVPYSNTIYRISVYCEGKIVETVWRKLYRVSSQWAVKFETRMHRIFVRDGRLGIEVEDRYAFKYTSTGSFPA